MLSPGSATQPPTRKLRRRATNAASSRSRLFPIPASPSTRTTVPAPERARSSCSLNTAIWAFRPQNGTGRLATLVTLPSPTRAVDSQSDPACRAYLRISMRIGNGHMCECQCPAIDTGPPGGIHGRPQSAEHPICTAACMPDFDLVAAHIDASRARCSLPPHKNPINGRSSARQAGGLRSTVSLPKPSTRSWPAPASPQLIFRPGALARTLTPKDSYSPPGAWSPTGC